MFTLNTTPHTTQDLTLTGKEIGRERGLRKEEREWLEGEDMRRIEGIKMIEVSAWRLEEREEYQLRICNPSEMLAFSYMMIMIVLYVYYYQPHQCIAGTFWDGHCNVYFKPSFLFYIIMIAEFWNFVFSSKAFCVF